MPAFAWHEHPGENRFWIGGPMTFWPTGTLRVTYSDGTVEESRITSPAYIVPSRQHTADGAHIVGVVLLGQDGRVLEQPSPGACSR